MLRIIGVGFMYLSVKGINACCRIINTVDLNEFCRDHFHLMKDKEITIVSMNINSLQIEGWKEKNNAFRDFCIRSKVDIIGIQECNVN